MTGVICDNSTLPHAKGTFDTMVVQPAMLYEMETLLMSRFHVKKLEVTEMKMSRWACGHILRYHVINYNTREKLNVEDNTERCRKARLA